MLTKADRGLCAGVPHVSKPIESMSLCKFITFFLQHLNGEGGDRCWKM